MVNRIWYQQQLLIVKLYVRNFRIFPKNWRSCQFANLKQLFALLYALLKMTDSIGYHRSYNIENNTFIGAKSSTKFPSRNAISLFKSL